MDFFQKRYDYTGNWNISGHCYLYINKNLVIATNAKENHSTSITNMGIRLAEMISKSESIPLDKMVFIEHYCKDDSIIGEDTFNLINLNNFEQAIPERISLDVETVKVIDKLIDNPHLAVFMNFK